MSEVPSIRLEGLFGEIPLRSSGDFAVAADIEVPDERSGISPKRPSSRMEGTSDMRAQDFTTSGLRTLYKRR